ncbi:hypothetical protein [Streptomyces sp. MJM8645]|uniref:hypothetical protein n=1 Tax=Streptomycetaceae TaxID=2062 RepID=UPI001331B3B5|nr:hypothetical protein [Streptomyces sp. MJM8645]
MTQTQTATARTGPRTGHATEAATAQEDTGWTGRAPDILRSYYLGATVTELLEWYGIPDRNRFNRFRLLHHAPARPPRRPRAADAQPQQAGQTPEDLLVRWLPDLIHDMEQRVLTSLMGTVL